MNTFSVAKVKLHRYAAFAFIIFFFLSPTIKIPGLLGLRLDDLFAFFLLFLYLFIPSLSTSKLLFPLRAVLVMLFGVLMMGSIAWGTTFGLPTNILDLTKYIWLIKVLVVYLFFYNYIYSEGSTHEDTTIKRDKLLSFLIIAALISSILCFTQFVNLFGMNKYYIPIIAPTQATTLMEGYSTPRVVGMIGNPNAQGYILGLAFVSLVYLQLKLYSTIRSLVGLVILVALFMTLSRTSLVITFFGATLMLFMYKKDLKFIYIKLVFVALFITICLALMVWIRQNQLLYDLIFWRFESLGNIMEDKSFVARFHGWAINIEYLLKSPLIGVGPIPRGAEVFGAADNEWLYFARSYGSIGLGWLILFFFLPLVLIKHSHNVEALNFRSFIIVVILMTMIYMIPAGVFTSSSLNGLLIVLLAMYDKKVKVLTNKKVRAQNPSTKY